MEQKYSKNSPTIKRILQELREFQKEKNPNYTAQPLEDNIFEWHFTIRGQRDTDFEGGIYHGRIVLPSDYPFKPPSIYFLTENGRFVVGHKICLSISAYHPETWQPSWSIRTALVALISFMPSGANGAIGAMDCGPAQRRILAARSVQCPACPKCGVVNAEILPGVSDEEITGEFEGKKEDMPIFFSTHDTKKSADHNHNQNQDQNRDQSDVSQKQNLDQDQNQPDTNKSDQDQSNVNQDQNQNEIDAIRKQESSDLEISNTISSNQSNQIEQHRQSNTNRISINRSVENIAHIQNRNIANDQNTRNVLFVDLAILSLVLAVILIMIKMLLRD